MYKSIDTKFKNRENTSVVIEVRIVVTLRNSDWRGHQGSSRVLVMF